jgi:hypothetical protein
MVNIVIIRPLNVEKPESMTHQPIPGLAGKCPSLSRATKKHRAITYAAQRQGEGFLLLGAALVRNLSSHFFRCAFLNQEEEQVTPAWERGLELLQCIRL